MGGYSASGDKRATPRYTTHGAPARLGWKVGEAYRTIDVRLKDISMGGFAAIAAAAPPADSPIWVCLDAGETESWVEVSLVAATRGRILFVPKRTYLLRLKFTNGCTFDFFKHAIRGFAQDHVSQDYASDDLKWFNSQSWR
ncbi:MAG: hypothetical protein P4L84_28250 [Isosphaeraceae bacterium]|nr:hypothetical protein [Isosphaeraceae bacterium]